MTRDEILNMPAGREKIKICPKCGSTRRMLLKTGYTQCHDCHNKQTREYNRNHPRTQRWNKTPEAILYRRNWQLNNRYGLSPDEYKIIYDKQDGRCAICGKITEIDLCVDHNHQNNKVRGLLCNSCNCGLANFKDNPDLLTEAAKYLSRASLLAVMEDEK